MCSLEIEPLSHFFLHCHHFTNLPVFSIWKSLQVFYACVVWRLNLFPISFCTVTISQTYQFFPYENHYKCYKKLVSTLWLVLVTVTYFVLKHFAGKEKVIAITVFLSKLDERPPFNHILTSSQTFSQTMSSRLQIHIQNPAKQLRLSA